MKADINVTPLVDIVLVLLIIFIVITPAVSDAVRLPAARHGAVPGREHGGDDLTLVLAARRGLDGKVTGPGLVQVEGKGGSRPFAPGGTPRDAEKDGKGRLQGYDLAEPEGRGQLEAFVKAAMARASYRRVFIKADLDLPYKHVDGLLRLCRAAGAEEASVVTRVEKEGGG